MTSERIALTINDDADRCHECGDVIQGEPHLTDDYGDTYCTAECVETHEAIRIDRAYESFLEDFYGGSQPVTIEEQYQAAAEEKRKLK